MAKFLTNASGATWWLNFQQMHVVTLADDDTNSILNIARGTMDPLVDTITGGTLWWPNFLPMQVGPPGGQIVY